MDIWPTLADLAGLAPPTLCASPQESESAAACTEGVSLAATVRDPRLPAKRAAFYQWPKSGNMGYTLVTHVAAGWAVRYTEWVHYDKVQHRGNWSQVAGVELCELLASRAAW